MRHRFTIALAPALLLACSSSPVVNPTRNLQYPVDLTMLCLKLVPASPADGTLQLSGQTMSVCHARDEGDPPPASNGRRQLGTFAFIINAGTSEVAVADMDAGRLLDLGPQAPGYGMLPVGSNPQAIASSEDGCWVVTANRSSCDLSLIDPARLLAGIFASDGSPAPSATGPGDASRRLVVKTGGGRVLQASTGEIAFLPPPSPSSRGQADLRCQADDRPMAVATFPGCDLVATLSLSFAEGSATITNAYYVRPDLPGGFLPAGAEPVCPNACGIPADGGWAAKAAGPTEVDGGLDGGESGIDAAAAPSEGAFHLQPLALVPGGERVYVASLLDSAITSFDLTPSGLANPARFVLAESPIGVNRLRLGIDPYRTVPTKLADDTPATVQGQFLTDRGKFLYAFTRDDSIRVVDIGKATPVECDVNTIAPPDQKARSCFPVGSASNPPRRPLARGPGIRIPTFSSPDSPPPLPRDLAFADLQPVSTDVNYHALSGQFGFLLASNGQVYILNLAPRGEDGTSSIPATSCATYLRTEATSLPATATHSFRDVRNLGQCSRVPLTISITPQRAVVTSNQAFATVADFAASEGPQIKQFKVDSDSPNQWVDFPDPDAIVSRVWNIIWEGALPYATRESGVVRGADSRAAGMLVDMGARFCASSVQPGDILAFSGCMQNSDCQPDDRFSCQGTTAGARGMCLPIDAARSAALVEACARFFGSRMRYEVQEARQTSLTLGLKLDEVPKTTLNPCKVNADCRPDVDHGLQAAETPDGGVGRAFECIEIHDKDPRCVKRCQQDSDCRTGNVCESVPGVLAKVGKLCVEAPPLDASCLPQPMSRYSVHAGKSFVIYGSSLPTMRTLAAPSREEACRPVAGRDPSLVFRIPLSAPECPASFLGRAGPHNAATGGPRFVQNLEATAGFNPCLYTGSYSDGGEAALDGGTTAGSQRIRAFFENPQIRFVLANLDQYVGDLFGIHFELQYGFVPLTVQIPPAEVLVSLGTRILTGPTKTPESPLRIDPSTAISYPYLYVIDQGNTRLTWASHGQVLRINPRAGTNEIATFDTAITGGTSFQLQ